MGMFDGFLGMVSDIISTDMVNSANAASAGRAMNFSAAEAEKNRNFQSMLWHGSAGFAANEAAKQREWQQKMSSTQYQRAIGDMKAAGLNPMLAYHQGGAGSGSGASASAPGVPSGSTGSGFTYHAQKMNAAMAGATLQSVLAGVDATKADAELKRAEALRVAKTAEREVASAENLRMSTTRMETEIPNIRRQLDKLEAEIKGIDTRAVRDAKEAALADARSALAEADEQLSRGRVGLVPAQKAFVEAQTKLQELLAPRAENEARAQGSWWMREVGPYENSAKNAAQILGKIFGR